MNPTLSDEIRLLRKEIRRYQQKALEDLRYGFISDAKLQMKHSLKLKIQLSQKELEFFEQTGLTA